MRKLFISVLLLLSISTCIISCKNSSSRNNLQSIPLELTTHLGDQQEFIQGDEIQFLLSLGSNAYIYLYYIDADDKLTQLLPNPNQSSNYYTAGYFLTIPEYQNGYRFIIDEPFGEEQLWVLASDQQISTASNDRSLDEIKETIKRGSVKAYGEYVLKIKTRKK